MDSAPLIFFDRIQTLGVRDGVAHLTLTARKFRVDAALGVAAPVDDPIVHLRFPLAALADLKRALDDIELAAQPATGAKN